MYARIILVAVAVTHLAVSVSAQRVPLRLPAADATHPVTFSGIEAIRELADGRVLVLDRAESRLALVDFRAGTAATIGKKGEGPQEYLDPYLLVPMRGDSSLVVDGRLGRWILLAGDRPVATLPANAPIVRLSHMAPLGTDMQGRIVASFIPTGLGRATDQGDSLYLARYPRGTGSGDTLGRLRSGYGGAPGTATKATPMVEMEYQPGEKREFMMHPLLGDQAAVFMDGWTALVRMDPYRVDWTDPTGKVIRGAPIAAKPVALTDREKRFYLARLSEEDGKPAGAPADIKDWLATLPPFWADRGTVLAAPRGTVVIARVPSADASNPAYDLVNRSGGYLGQLVLGRREKIVGFGAGAVYVVVADADGVQQLRRHRWTW